MTDDPKVIPLRKRKRSKTIKLTKCCEIESPVLPPLSELLAKGCTQLYLGSSDECIQLWLTLRVEGDRLVGAEVNLLKDQPGVYLRGRDF
jgi:hypothetical protein